jgi:hypothetical protein
MSRRLSERSGLSVSRVTPPLFEIDRMLVPFDHGAGAPGGPYSRPCAFLRPSFAGFR